MLHNDALENFPAGQPQSDCPGIVDVEQLSPADNPEAGQYMPIGHDKQADALVAGLKEPAEQLVGLEERAGQYVARGQIDGALVPSGQK